MDDVNKTLAPGKAQAPRRAGANVFHLFDGLQHRGVAIPTVIFLVQRNPGGARLLPNGLFWYAGMRLACLRRSLRRRQAAVVTWRRRVLRQKHNNGE